MENSVITKDKVIDQFTYLLKNKLNNRIVQIILYGSRARGDNSLHSDYDFLIIVNKKNPEQKQIVLDICFEILDKYNSLISFLLYDEREWERKKKYPLGLNILEEGIKV